MTTEHEPAGDELATARQARRRGKTRLAAVTAGAGVVSAVAGDLGGVMSAQAVPPEADGWLTAILRPAGTLDERAAGRLCEALEHLAASSDMVIVNLTATAVARPRALAVKLMAPARMFDRAGRCLLVIGASPELTAELDGNAVPVITLAADALPSQVRPTSVPA
jgi:hypothetical protein